MKRLEALNAAMQAAYEESLYDDGFLWLLEDARKAKSDAEVAEMLTDANMHTARTLFEVATEK